MPHSMIPRSRTFKANKKNSELNFNDYCKQSFRIKKNAKYVKIHDQMSFSFSAI